MAQPWKRTLGRYWLALLAVVVVISLAAAGVLLARRGSPPAGPGRQGANSATGIPANVSAQTQGEGGSPMGESGQRVSIHLSEGKAHPQVAVPVPLATGQPLPEEQINAILARLPELTPEPGEGTDFRLPQELLPPPRPGQTIKESFPPPPEVPQPTQAAAGPLEVLRFAPEGEISIAPFINITFNQPMVPLTALEDLAAKDVPVQIDPPLNGTWRWLGTRTLNFQYNSELIDRLPKATEYRVTILAGTRSATGSALAETVEWTFKTPPLKMVATYPGGTPQPLEPVFFIAFDQRIDPAAVLETIQVSAGGRPLSLKMAGEADFQADVEVSRLVKDTAQGRWLAFKAAQPLPGDTDITVTVGPGTPSAEGPLVTQEAQSFSFRTYAPLRIEEHGCAWGNDPCQPLTPLFIRFDNPIDAAAYQETMLKIEPELPGATVDILGNTLQIRGATKGQTTYTVTVSGEIRDIFGQKLGQDVRLEFKIGPAEPRLVGPDSLLVTLDPAANKPVFSVYSLNYTRLDLNVYAVQPSDWPAFIAYVRDFRYNNKIGNLPGRLVIDKTLRPEAPADALSEVGVDLSQAMDGKFGHFIVVIKLPRELFQNDQERDWQTVMAWVQVTQIGLDAYADHSEMVAWATSLKDGAPLQGVTITAGDITTATGEDGLARFNLPPTHVSTLVARLGADQAILPRSTYYWGDDAWQPVPPSDELRWYVFDDRGMYRPGEEVHLKGWLRRIGGRQDGDVGLVGGDGTSISYQLNDSQGNNLGSGQAHVDALGGFDITLKLPEQVNLGYAQLTMDAAAGLSGFSSYQYYHQFQIQEFRRPEFEVTARNETPGPYFAGETATVAVEAKYYAGGPLPDAEVTWQVSYSPGSYAPPGWPDFSFGVWRPWWFFEEPVYRGGPGGGETRYETFTGKTDASGQHFLQLTFESDRPEPISVQAEATVMDVNRQAWTGATQLLVHPAGLYVGLRSDRYFVERGTPIKVDVIVTDLDGLPVSDRPVEVRAARLEWKLRGGNWGEEEVDPQTCTVGSAQEPVACTFETPVGGSYNITAEVKDDRGRLNRSQITRWVSGGELPPARKVELEKVTLIPDKESYQPGDVAKILVQSPFTPAEGLLTVTRSGILTTQRFRVVAGAATLEVPIEEKHIPNLNVQVDLVGSAPRSDDRGEPVTGAPPRPAYATGQLDLRIPPLQRALSLEVTPQEKELEPGGETAIDILVKDANGQPVPEAEVAVVVVDEAILALSNYQPHDPLSIFYADRPSYLDSRYGRASIVLANPQALAGAAIVAETQVVEKVVQRDSALAAMEAPAAAMPTQTAAAQGRMAVQPGSQPIRMRLDFNPLAVFSPAVRTDANGRAQVPVKLPDNLTRYRVIAVAVAGGKQFGSAETNLTARLPLMARPSAPRFLNFGDQLELPVVVQNQTDQPMEVDVVLRASNLELTGVDGQPLTGATGLRVTVPARDRVEVRFPARTMLAGKARFQVAAVSGDYADAATGELPVYTPATTEAFAVYGVLDGGADGQPVAVAQPVEAPHNVFPQYGGLEISTSSTALQALTDAVLYLTSYPFECSEQLASRVLAISALREVLTAFNAQGLPSPQEMEAAVVRDIERLHGMQNGDGGFPYWRRGGESIPFNTIHAANALQKAEQMGFAVPAEMKQPALEYLRSIESHYPSWYSQHTRWTLSAYALYVRSQSGDRDPGKARKLLEEAGLENLPLEAVGWLWPVLQDDPSSSAQLDAIRRHVSNRAVETAGAANFTTDYDDQTYLLLSSDRRTDAILLEALIVDNPQHDLIPKVVNGLLAHRKQGRWGNTEENVFVLLALDRYFDTFEAQTPDFVARFWLGETYAGSHEFHGRTTERRMTDIPMSYLLDSGNQDLILSMEGGEGTLSGRLYYRLGLRYAPTDLKQDPLDMGFVVRRSYEAVDDPADVSRDENGAWHIKAGARVRVKLTMVADNRRYHVALVDRLPAGLEIVNPELAVSGSIPQDPTDPGFRYGWWWNWTWYEHQNLRDERAEAFASLLWDGVYDYTYIARATTPGTFIVPPAKAEEMYSPEVFGRSASDVVIVE